MGHAKPKKIGRAHEDKSVCLRCLEQSFQVCLNIAFTKND
jgi:hypothetical protein